jgi:hypothetical protein
MTESTLDPLDTFVRHVRTMAADNQQAVVGPVSYGGADNRYLVEVVVGAIDPTPNRPFTSTVWRFEVKPVGDDSTVMSAWDTWHFLGELLRRDFQSVERCGNELDFARVVEKRWPCPEATAARERFELREQGRQAWDARRVTYIARRDREGAQYSEAYVEFMESDPPDY